MPMSDLSRTASVPGAAPPTQAAGTPQHPSTFAPATFVFLISLCLFGPVIGLHLILQLGETPNTSIIGALVAMLLARVPGAIFARYRSIHVQNLAQSAISAATFGAANSLLLPIGVPFLLGRSDLILPMLIGAALSMLLDAYLLYRMFDTRVFPATGIWPPGVAAAEAIKAGDVGGRKAALLGAGLRRHRLSADRNPHCRARRHRLGHVGADAGAVRRLCGVRGLHPRADRRHRGDALRLVPGVRRGADHADHRHPDRVPAGGARA